MLRLAEVICCRSVCLCFALATLFEVNEALAQTQTVTYLPQVVNGIFGTPPIGGLQWGSSLMIANPGSSRIDLTVDFVQSNGQPFIMSFGVATGSLGSGARLVLSLNPGESRTVDLPSGGDIKTGYAIIQSNRTVSLALLLYQSFITLQVQRLLGQAAVSPTSLQTNQGVFVNDVGGFRTGVAIANPGYSSTSFLLRLLNSDGSEAARLSDSLPPNTQKSRFVDEYLSLARNIDYAGTLRISSDNPVAVLVLRFAPDGSFTSLQSFPVTSSLK